MSNFIKEKSLSVGYNLGGQEFFDTLSKNWRWIHSYFFSFMYNMEGIPLKSDDVNISLMDSDTYGFPANLLLNTYDSKDCWKELILMALDVTNLTAVTVLTPDVAKLVKDTFPELEVHLSVRFWETIATRGSFCHIIENIEKWVDVINLSSAFSFNDKKLVDKCIDMGLKIKWLYNQGCIVNKSRNYNTLNGCDKLMCIPRCNRYACTKVVDLYPWMNLARDIIYKESLKFLQYDIIKISSRDIDDINNINWMINYWTSSDRTRNIFDIEISDDAYPFFLEYIKTRSSELCTGICSKCRNCDYYYYMMKSI